MSKVSQKRTKKVRDIINKEWHNYWWKFINSYQCECLDWSWISENPNLTMDIINANLDKPWEWYFVSHNPNITIKDILDNPDKPWEWDYISMNPNLTMKDILDNPDKPWRWNLISQNKFTKEKEQFIEPKYRQHIAAILIQNAYKNALVDHKCEIGINRIKRDAIDVGIVI